MLQHLEVEFPKIVCSTCGVETNANTLEASKGMCICRGTTFDITIRVRKHFEYKSDATESSGIAAAALASGRVGRLASRFANDNVSESTEESDYVLTRISSPTFFALTQAQPQNVLDFLSGLRREAAKANLQPGQGICRECENVFTIAYAGFSAEGYCSKICKSKHERENPEEKPVAAAPQKASVVNCPKCAKSTKIRPGKNNVCIWCGTAIGLA